MSRLLAPTLTPAEARPGADLTPAVPLDLDWLSRQVDALPALPQVVLEAQKMLQREGSSVEDCAGRIARDPAITARVLRLANSPFYGRAGRVATVQDAVVLLGRRTLGTLLSAATVTRQFDATDCPGFDFAAFWRHAFGCAIAAQAMAVERRADEALAFSAGLLHDIGRLALVAYAPVPMAAVLAWARAADVPLLQAERRLLGLDHVQVGGAIAAHWQFPPLVVAAIREHHTPLHERGGGLPREAAELADVVQAADAITHALAQAGTGGEHMPDTDPALWPALGLPEAACLRVSEHTRQGMAALSAALLP